MFSRRAFLRMSLCITPTLLLTTACSGSRPGVTAKLDHGPSVSLGGTMTFTLTASCVWDVPNPDPDGTKTTATKVSFDMTEGLVPLNLSWAATPLREGMISYSQPVVFKADVPQSFEVSVRLDQEGEQQISGVANVLLVRGAHSDGQTLFLNVSSLGTQIRRTPFNSTTYYYNETCPLSHQNVIVMSP